MKNYLKTNGIRVAVLVLSVVLLIGLGAAARGGSVGLLHDATGVLIAPVQKVVRKTALSPRVLACSTQIYRRLSFSTMSPTV